MLLFLPGSDLPACLSNSTPETAQAAVEQLRRLRSSRCATTIEVERTQPEDEAAEN